jgi:spore germination protein GerM
MSHARAIQLLSSNEVKSKYIAVIGTNIDVGHGVLQSDIDARLTTLSPHAVFQWLWNYEDDENIRHYVDIVSRCNPQDSIVHSLVCAALQGHRGYYLPKHLRSRIRKSIVPLGEDTCLSTGYHLDDVMRDNIYFNQLTPQMNLKDVQQIIYATKRNNSLIGVTKNITHSNQSISNPSKLNFSRLIPRMFSPNKRTFTLPRENNGET